MVRRGKNLWVVLGLLAVGAMGVGCQGRAPSGTAGGEGGQPGPAEGVLTVGDVDPQDPAGRVRRLQPLADHLASRLAGHGIAAGRVVVARDIPEMTRLVRDGVVDLQLSSPVPVLRVQQAAGSRILLRRWVEDYESYSSVFFTHRDRGPTDLSDLEGGVLALKDTSSTSSYLLPVAHLVERGLAVRQLQRVDDPVGPDEVGLLLTGAEQDIFDAVLDGAVVAGATSDQEFAGLPHDLRDQLRIFGHTVEVPRALVAARPGLDPALVARVEELLLGLTDDEREALAAADGPLAWTWRFEPLTPEVDAVLVRLEQLTAGVGAGS